MKKFKVYGTKNCRYCVNAVNALARRGYDYEYVCLESDDEARKFIVEHMGLRKVPQIFCDEEHIGGFTELVRYLSMN